MRCFWPGERSTPLIAPAVIHPARAGGARDAAPVTDIVQRRTAAVELEVAQVGPAEHLEDILVRAALGLHLGHGICSRARTT